MKKNLENSTTDKVKIRLANPYQLGQMGTFGKAKEMLLKQYQFPAFFEQHKDEIASDYLDRIQVQYPEDSKKCLKKFGLEGGQIEVKLRIMEDNNILDFLCEIMKVEREKYTGYRIIGDVGDNGRDYYCFQLFYKHPDTDTEVFSGEHAPNVRIKTH